MTDTTQHGSANTDTDNLEHLRGHGVGRDYAAQHYYDKQHPDALRTVLDPATGALMDAPTTGRQWANLVGAYGETPIGETRESSSIVSIPGVSGVAYEGAGTFKGFTVAETAGATAKIRFRRQNVNGPIVAVKTLTANESATTGLPDGINVNGIYVEIVSGAIEGSLFVGSVE